jgi:hypothetical protein
MTEPVVASAPPYEDDIHEGANRFSTALSDRVRQLAFAGVAIGWLFKIDATDGPVLPKALVWAIVLFAVGLTLDLVHVAVGAYFYSGKSIELVRRDAAAYVGQGLMKRPAVISPPVAEHLAVTRAMQAIFWTKVSAVVIGYIILIVAIAHMIRS